MRSHSNSILLLTLAVIALAMGGCSDQSSQESKVVTTHSNLTAHQQEQQARAIKAQTKLLRVLQQELQHAISDPAKAISVCKKRGDLLARSIGQEMNVRIGRTSAKIRNLNNVPPVWAAEWVQQRHDRRLVVSLPNSGLGLLSPIMTKSICINCHGKQGKIDPDVFAEILSLYPDDMATGFSVGELRGYVWVEVPAIETQE